MSEEIQLGDCMRIACEQVIDNNKLFFCYAYVGGQGELQGQRIIHAWNELGDMVFDYSNGNKVIVRKEKYYDMAQIKEKDITKQTYDEIMKLMFKTKTYGGWIK